MSTRARARVCGRRLGRIFVAVFLSLIVISLWGCEAFAPSSLAQQLHKSLHRSYSRPVGLLLHSRFKFTFVQFEEKAAKKFSIYAENFPDSRRRGFFDLELWCSSASPNFLSVCRLHHRRESASCGGALLPSFLLFVFRRLRLRLRLFAALRFRRLPLRSSSSSPCCSPACVYGGALHSSKREREQKPPTRAGEPRERE